MTGEKFPVFQKLGGRSLRDGAYRKPVALRRKSTRSVAFIPLMTTSPPLPEQLVSVSVAASRLNISVRSLYRLVSRQELASPLKVGRSSKLCESDLAAYVQKLKDQRP